LIEIYVQTIQDRSDLKAQTISRYKQSAEGAILTAFRGVAVSEMTAGQIRRFLDSLIKGNRISEARNCRVVLRAILRLAAADNAISRNPFAEADIRMPTATKKARALTAGELVDLRRLISEHRTAPGAMGPRPSTDLPDLVNVMLGLGMRISETLALRTEDLRLSPDGGVRVTVSGTIIYEPGTGALRQSTTKSGRVRAFDAPLWVAEILRRRSEQSVSGLLWESRNGRPLQQQNLSRTLRSALSKSDLQWVTSHTLRKTAGTEIAIRSGVSLATEVLGHSSDHVTRSIYIDRDQIVSDLTTATANLSPK
jgi:integrase